jgi:Na+-transporting methylmalonyl-CoA/oxaloacetate decarboxylase beta subunit
MIWKLFKGTLSAVLVAVAAVLLWLGATRTFEPWLLGVVDD